MSAMLFIFVHWLYNHLPTTYDIQLPSKIKKVKMQYSKQILYIIQQSIGQRWEKAVRPTGLQKPTLHITSFVLVGGGGWWSGCATAGANRRSSFALTDLISTRRVLHKDEDKLENVFIPMKKQALKA